MKKIWDKISSNSFIDLTRKAQIFILNAQFPSRYENFISKKTPPADRIFMGINNTYL